jgi:glycosyltransferase involved in cell wall biosynthesis
MTEPPRISVILLAFNRMKYVKGGVASALNQTFPRDRYEILVFKNFEDPEIDSYLAANGVRSLTSPPTSRPRTMRTVLQEARGEILCFLDDDDLFLPDKLATVDRVFTEDPTLGYFHNGFVVVDEDLRPFDRTPFPQAERRVYIPAGDGRTRAVPPNVLRLGFNTSSVSVRRNWLTPYLPSFEHREAEWSDTMLLCCALVSGCAVLADPTKLTHYRYHDSWSNILHYSMDSVGPLAEMDTVNVGVLNLIAGVATNSTLAPLVADDLVYARFHRSIFDDRADWRPRLRDFYRFLAGCLHQGNYAPFYIIPLHLLAKVSPVGARRTYFGLAERYRHHSYQSAPGN